MEQRAQKVLDSMNAFEEMMHLFYQHKGLNNNAAAAVDRVPVTHLNIRYQRMFAGAFMYASGNHIGIEWGSTSGMMSGVPVSADADGKYVFFSKRRVCFFDSALKNDMALCGFYSTENMEREEQLRGAFP